MNNQIKKVKKTIFHKIKTGVIDKKIFVDSVGFILFIWILVGIITPIFFWFSNPTSRGQFGDMFGGVNSLFSGLSAIFSFFTVVLIIRDNRMARNQFKRQSLNDQMKTLADLTLEFVKLDGPGKIINCVSLMYNSEIEYCNSESKIKSEKGLDKLRKSCSLLKSQLAKCINSDSSLYHFPAYPEVKSILQANSVFSALNKKDISAANKILDETMKKTDDFRFVIAFLIVYIRIFLPNKHAIPDLIGEYFALFYYYLNDVLKSIDINEVKSDKLKMLVEYGKFKNFLM